MKEQLAPVFEFPVRVYWEDTDAGGIVFYANYLKYFERARTEWLRSLGLQQHTLKAIEAAARVKNIIEKREATFHNFAAVIFNSSYTRPRSDVVIAGVF